MFKVLYTDDEPVLLDLGKLFLESSGTFTVETALSAHDALQMLKSRAVDCIVSDYQMPGMNGIAFLKVLRGEGNQIPFILFTGRGREEVVIEALNNGADFYLQKGGDPKSQFAELAHKIRLAVERSRTTKALEESEEKYRSLVDLAPLAVVVHQEGRIVYANPESVRVAGATSAADLIGREMLTLIHPDDRPVTLEHLQLLRQGAVIPISEIRLFRIDGQPLTVETAGKQVMYGGIPSIIVVYRDITDRKKQEDELRAAYEQIAASEEELRSQYDELALAQEKLLESQQQLAGIAGTVPGVVYQFFARPDGTMGLYYVSDLAEEVLGISRNTGDFFERFTRHVDSRDREAFLNSVNDAVNSKSSWDFTGRFKKPSGETIWFRGISRPFERGGELVFSGFFLDITKRKQEEESLFNSRQMLQVVLDSIPQRVFWKDRNSVFLGCNMPLALDAGFTDPSGIVGKTDYDHASHATADLYRKDDREVMESGQPRINYEEPQIKPDGSHAWLRTTKVPLRDKEGMIIGVLGTYEDITERKRMEEAFRQSEELLRLFIEHAPAALAMLDKELRYIAASSRWMADYHLGDRDLKGHSHLEIFPELAEDIREVLRRGLAGETTSASEDRFERQDGSVQYLAWEVRPWYTAGHDIGGVIIFSEDITKRKTAEIALQALIRSMVGTTGVNSLRMITENVCSWLNADCVMIGEIQPDEKTVRVLSMLLDGKEVSGFTYTLKGTPCENVKEKGFCLYPDNAARRFPESRDLIELNIRGYIGTPLRNYEGRVIGILCALFRNPVKAIPSVQEIMDIIAVKAAAEIERKQVEETLAESENRYRSVIENIHAAVVVHNPDTSIRMINTTALDLLGLTPDEAIGRDAPHPSWHFSREDGSVLPLAQYPVNQVITTQKPLRNMLLEIFRPKSQDTIWGLINADPEYDENGTITAILVTFTDISGRKRAEEALRQANRKLNLMSGITRHDIKNQLFTLNGFLEISKDYLNDAAKMSEFVVKEEKIAKTMERQIAFTKEYEAIGIRAPVWQDCRTIFETAVKQALLGNIMVKNDLPAGLEVFADPLIVKVCYNLIDNAVRYGGKITTIRFFEEDHDGCKVIVCADNGEGIPTEEKEKIFERGFGKNTGMGLFLAREILEITGITIHETGEPGNGARFEITVMAGQFRIT